MAEVPACEVEPGYFENDKARAQQGRYALGKHSRQGRASDAHAERQNKEQIQKDVERAGNDEKEERGPAVAESRDGTGKDIEEQSDAHAPHGDFQIGDRIPEDVRRRVHENENGARCGYPAGCHNDGYERTQNEARQKTASETESVARAEPLGADDGEARGHADDKAQDKEENAACGADAGERADAQRAAHDDRVHHAVYLLEGVSAEQRKGEEKDEARGAAVGEFLGHEFS